MINGFQYLTAYYPTEQKFRKGMLMQFICVMFEFYIAIEPHGSLKSIGF